MLIWANFDSFANTYLIRQLSSKVSFSNSGYAEFFVNTEGPETSFQVEVFVEFFDNFFSFKT